LDPFISGSLKSFAAQVHDLPAELMRRVTFPCGDNDDTNPQQLWRTIGCIIKVPFFSKDFEAEFTVYCSTYYSIPV
jgi:hypothetical protein